MRAQKKSAPNNERLAEIYRAAAQIILRKGYDATSVNDIANALGMTKAGLYHYINGKKELLFDIMNFGLGELDAEVAEPAKAIADPSAASVISSSSPQLRQSWPASRSAND